MFHYRSIVQRVKQRVAAVLLPWRCLLCYQASDQARDLCCACQQQLCWLDQQRCCHYCAALLPVESDCHLCGRCLVRAPYFDHTVALWRYHGMVATAIQRLKFHQQLVWGRLLGELMAEALEVRAYRPQQIIPVPLHRARLRQRGFNQALELARPIAKALAVPINFHSCQRTNNTPMQSLLPFNQRYSNVRQAFTILTEVAEHVAIIDDVMTSGHTINELSRALRQAGVKRIEVWCCARAGQSP